MRETYRAWLQANEYQAPTINAQLHRVGKVEQFYGDLDDLVSGGGYEALIAELTYSTADERAGRTNPSRIPVDGNIRNGLQSYKNAVALYRRFLLEDGDETALPGPVETAVRADASGEAQRLSLERDMQTALRRDIESLEPGLRIVDEGIERGVLSGYIDILCRDSADRLVVVELKAGKADSRVIGQTLGYMGDLMEEEGTETVRGMIVAHGFDQRTKSAAKAVPALSLHRYAISFVFEREE